MRNRGKVTSAIGNARATLELQAAGSSLVEHLWSFVDGKPVVNAFTTDGSIPSETDASRAMSRDLRAKGFRFVGPTICYALMQSAGLVNDHVTTCFRYEEVQRVTSLTAGDGQREARQASRSFIRPPVWSTAPE